jgi:hypothetical protein
LQANRKNVSSPNKLSGSLDVCERVNKLVAEANMASKLLYKNNTRIFCLAVREAYKKRGRLPNNFARSELATITVPITKRSSAKEKKTRNLE